MDNLESEIGTVAQGKVHDEKSGTGKAETKRTRYHEGIRYFTSRTETGGRPPGKAPKNKRWFSHSDPDDSDRIIWLLGSKPVSDPLKAIPTIDELPPIHPQGKAFEALQAPLTGMKTNSLSKKE